VRRHRPRKVMTQPRTSLTDPLPILPVLPAPGAGRIGITFCPGKIDPAATPAPWRRDLAADLDAIRDWRAAAVVTLVETRELDMLGVPDLGAQVARRGMAWFHLPIVDMAVPDAAFETRWVHAGAALRALLVDGRDIVVHCRGGLGRAGTIAARLLVEFGVAPDDAIRIVRRARPGAIETVAQENHVRGLRPG
jgi:ADP-ribosyl-[dinitrogen reductase] hydrolase